jgi:hypothetical protein
MIMILFNRMKANEIIEITGFVAMMITRSSNAGSVIMIQIRFRLEFFQKISKRYRGVIMITLPALELLVIIMATNPVISMISFAFIPLNKIMIIQRSQQQSTWPRSISAIRNRSISTCPN